MKNIFVEVIVPRPVRQLFTYSVPDDLKNSVAPGKRVEVPFGKRSLIGLAAKLSQSSSVEAKPIIAVLDAEPAVPEKLLKLALWTARHYYAAPGDMLPLILPRGDVKIDTFVILKDGAEPPSKPEKAAQIYEILSAKGGKRKLELLAADLGLTAGELKKFLTADSAKAFTNIEQNAKEIASRKRKVTLSETEALPVPLNESQQKAIGLVADDIEAGRFAVTLIHGVTGSGKTEVYAELARKALDAGKSVIALAPEIALANLLAERFRKRLGINASVIHSDMTPSARAAAWSEASAEGPRLITGARSAIFAPVKNLGLVIVDEEHDGSYKQDSAPRYNGRDVAVMRASMENAAVVLGSATPSLESYNNAIEGKYRLVELNERIDHRPMPIVETVDPERHGEIGERLKNEIAARLAKKEQTILFINRRGAARYVQCGVCGHAFECRNCSISLVFHSSTRDMRCHTCGYAEPAPDTCPKCASAEFIAGGAGSERVEKDMAEMFPTASLARMDRDTASRRGAGAKILHAVGSGGVDILIGTQMITKGHDYPNITLVGAVSADDTLHIPDFRAGERTFQLITQAAGRAGRGNTPGLVIAQTKSRDHHSVACAAKHDFKTFFEVESALRKETGYPPFKRLAFIRVDAANKESGEKFAVMAKRILDNIARKMKGLEALGPSEGVIFKIRNRYHWRILLKADAYPTLYNALDRFLDEANSTAMGKLLGSVRVSVDMDPLNVM